jgi:hypothetical protein
MLLGVKLRELLDGSVRLLLDELENLEQLLLGDQGLDASTMGARFNRARLSEPPNESIHGGATDPEGLRDLLPARELRGLPCRDNPRPKIDRERACHPPLRSCRAQVVKSGSNHLLTAVTLAIAGVRLMLSRSGELLTWDEQECGDYGIPRYIPRGFGLAVERRLVAMVESELAALVAEKESSPDSA